MRIFRWLLPLLALCQVLNVSAAPKKNQYTYRGTVVLDHSEEQPVLGISSIRYDKNTDEFILVSDDTGTIPNVYNKVAKPRFYKISGQAVLDTMGASGAPESERNLLLDAAYINEVHLTVNSDDVSWVDSQKWIHDGHIDTEGLALYNNSTDLLIASEQAAAYPFKSFRMEGNWDFQNAFRVMRPNVVPSLLQVDRHTGLLKQNYYFPSYYQSPFLRDALAYFTPKMLMRAYDWLTDENIGLLKNKGIESIDFIPGTNEVIAITEAPLRQDTAPWKEAYPATEQYPALAPPSRIIHLSLDDVKKEGNYSYPVVQKELLYGVTHMPVEYTSNPDAIIKTGVSDVVALSHSQLLVMERTQITFKANSGEPDESGKKTTRPPLSVVEIYKANLNLDPQYHVTRLARPTTEDMQKKRVVRKTLVFSSLLDTGTRLFQNLNMEGITFGPTLNGKPTIVLVNDNGATENNFTNLIFLTVD